MKKNLIQDKYFDVVVLSKTERPNLLSYLAMHQDYSESAVAGELEKLSNIPESELGTRVTNRCVKFGHWGVLEHPCITFNVIGFPHNVITQARTHRVGTSFDVQSGRYTSKRFINLAKELYKLTLLTESSEKVSSLKKDKIEKLFYLRPIGFYTDRGGQKYHYNETLRNQDFERIEKNVYEYYEKIDTYGFSPEHARSTLLYDFRQDFVVTFNLRSLLHFLDLRYKSDAQLEIQTLSNLLWEHTQKWVPEISNYYEKSRLDKNKLAP